MLRGIVVAEVRSVPNADIMFLMQERWHYSSLGFYRSKELHVTTSTATQMGAVLATPYR